MLLSPGHSPRHLASPSQSSYCDSTLTNVKNWSSATPKVPLKKRAKVLDEDAYVSAIESIIERDYFPDLSKLRDRYEWLQATRTGDPVQIRDAQLKIMERRGKKVLSLNSNGKFRTQTETPGSTFTRNFTPFDEFDVNIRTPKGRVESSGEVDCRDDNDEVDVSMNLDEFLRKHTSEDNDSFSKILEKVNRKRKERYQFLLEGEKRDNNNLIEDVKRDRITDGYGTSYQPPSTLEGWKYTAKNLLMYHPADCGEAPLTEEERAVRLKGLTKEVNESNTRFHGKIMDSRPKDDGTVEVLYTPVAGTTPGPVFTRDGDKMKKYDLDDMRKTPNRFYVESGKKTENGYSFVKTPSPAPGDDESPFITWGEIEGTPLRLETEDTPIDIGGSGDGPHFKIPSNWSNRPPKETIMLDGCDYQHWLIVMEFPKDPMPSEDEMINAYVKTLATVVGSEEEAKKKIYSVCTTTYTGFGALIDEELSYKVKGLPGVLWVLPDSYIDVPNKDYGGDLFIDGKIIHRKQYRFTERQPQRPRPRRRESTQADRRALWAVNQSAPTQQPTSMNSHNSAQDGGVDSSMNRG